MFTVLKRYGTAYFALLLIFLVSLFLICLIPSSHLKKNVGKAVDTFKTEGTYPSTGLPWRSIVLDNYTDALIINTAYSVDSTQPLKSALTNVRFAKAANETDQIVNLDNLYSGNALAKIGYERYWHGYLIFIRPLLTFLSYSEVRVGISFFQMALLAYFIYLSWKKLGIKIALFFLFGLISVDYFSIGKSIQFSSVFFIGLLASIYLLLTYKKGNRQDILFFIVGALTSYFDLLTAPLISLGLLLIVTTLLNKKKYILVNCLAWSAGYLSLWSTKWVIAQLFFSPGAITTSFNQIVNRTVTKADANFSQFNAIRLNIFQLIGYDRVDKFFVLGICCIFLLFFLRFANFNRQKIRAIIPWICIGLLPYLWYFVTANHSYIHVWYTYRNQLITVICIFLIASEFIDWGRVSREWNVMGKKLRLLSKPAIKNHND